jgi:hypothetical protein
MRLLAGSIPFMQSLPPNDVAAVCTLAATLAVARSPASAVSQSHPALFAQRNLLIKLIGAASTLRPGCHSSRHTDICLPLIHLPTHPPGPCCSMNPLTPTHPLACLPLQIAVLKETDGKGPYCSLVMAVVVVKDVLLFAMFAVNVELAKAVSQA